MTQVSLHFKADSNTKHSPLSPAQWNLLQGRGGMGGGGASILNFTILVYIDLTTCGYRGNQRGRNLVTLAEVLTCYGVKLEKQPDICQGNTSLSLIKLAILCYQVFHYPLSIFPVWEKYFLY